MAQKKIQITFPDSSTQEWPSGTTPAEIAQKIGARLAKDALAAKVNDKLVDLNFPIEENAKFEILTFDSEEGKHVYWHSSSHIMAAAIKNLFPEVKLGIGPPIEQGFYYDFSGKVFSDHELGKIEEEIKKLIKSAEPFERKEISKAEAKKLFASELFKLQLIEEIPDKKVSIYRTGNFVDLCEGPHVPSSDKIGALKLLKTSAAYWKGDQKNQQLQRIYGISFRTQKELDAFVKMREEAEARDHRNIGKALDLFSFHDFAPGFPFFHPKGTIIFNVLADFMRAEYRKRGYAEVITPQVLNKNLWVQSGHWEHYKKNMYVFEIEDEGEFAIKPMNCPSHIIIFKERPRSYKELPIRYADFATLHRHELSGTLAGLFRVRKLAQDDAHIFVEPEKIKGEIKNVIEFVKFIYEKVFGFEFHVELSTKPKDSMGDPKLWDSAEKDLAEALIESGMKYKLNPGDGAFYGPKIDFHIKDALGRTWQCATIQLDFQMPERFELEYVGPDNKMHMPVMIHRAILGSLERFIGILIEHYTGAFPLWLSPVQVRIITVSDKQIDFAKNISEKLLEAGLRAETDFSNATVEYKIRDSQLQKIPYTITIGDKEVEKKTLAVRGRDGKVKFGVSAEDFVEQMEKEIEEKK